MIGWSTASCDPRVEEEAVRHRRVARHLDRPLDEAPAASERERKLLAARRLAADRQRLLRVIDRHGRVAEEVVADDAVDPAAPRRRERREVEEAEVDLRQRGRADAQRLILGDLHRHPPGAGAADRRRLRGPDAEAAGRGGVEQRARGAAVEHEPQPLALDARLDENAAVRALEAQRGRLRQPELRRAGERGGEENHLIVICGTDSQNPAGYCT
jgi:hypothetical protein